MRITLTQSCGQRVLRGWILIRIETNDVCTQIWTSSTFDPYKRIYVWLGQIRDAQLPARTTIDEEGRGVELLAERVDDEILHFHIEPWFCGDDQSTRLSTRLEKHELISAFCGGIIEFISNEYRLLDWSNIDHLSNLNWATLLQPPSLPSQNWRARLAIYAGQGRVPNAELNCPEQLLTTEQQWLIGLHDVLGQIAGLAVRGETYESYALVSLYQNLLIDLALNEFDPGWYEKRRTEIDQGAEYLRTSRHIRTSGNKRYPERVRLEIQTRLSTLKLGQLVDGRVRKIKTYGVFVDIGELHTLLTNSTISQSPIDQPDQIFQINDWIRAMIIWIDIEKCRVLLSTSDLEPEPGDMLRNPLYVYEKAEEMVNRYRQNVLSKLLDE